MEDTGKAKTEDFDLTESLICTETILYQERRLHVQMREMFMAC